MEEENKPFTPQESLQLIEDMINRARNKFGENGHLYLLWGWAILFCSMAHFLLWQFKVIAYPQMIWLLTLAAMIYQVVYLVKRKKQQKVRTYTDDILGYVWLVFVICMFLILFVMIKKGAFDRMYPLFLVLYGMPTFLSGKILKVRVLATGGICCSIISVVATFIDLKFQLLLISLAVITAWIIPGYALQAKYKIWNRK